MLCPGQRMLGWSGYLNITEHNHTIAFPICYNKSTIQMTLYLFNNKDIWFICRSKLTDAGKERKKQYHGHFCTSPGCTNSYGQDKANGVKRSYYSYPLGDQKRLRMWLKSIPREDWKPTAYSKICSDHFVAGKVS